MGVFSGGSERAQEELLARIEDLEEELSKRRRRINELEKRIDSHEQERLELLERLDEANERGGVNYTALVEAVSVAMVNNFSTPELLLENAPAIGEAAANMAKQVVRTTHEREEKADGTK